MCVYQGVRNFIFRKILDIWNISFYKNFVESKDWRIFALPYFLFRNFFYSASKQWFFFFFRTIKYLFDVKKTSSYLKNYKVLQQILIYLGRPGFFVYRYLRDHAFMTSTVKKALTRKDANPGFQKKQTL